MKKPRRWQKRRGLKEEQRGQPQVYTDADLENDLRLVRVSDARRRAADLAWAVCVVPVEAPRRARCGGSGALTRRIVWRDRPERLFGVVTARGRSLGCWAARAEAEARAVLAQHRGAILLVLDEYTAKLPSWGHVKRVVVGTERVG